MKLTWYGHSAFRVDIDGAAILIDPFFTGNPVSYTHLTLPTNSRV